MPAPPGPPWENTLTTSRPLRLGVPAWTLVPGAMGGSETYARELLRALSGRADVDVTTFVGRGAVGALPAAHEVVAPRVAGGPSALL